MNNDKPSEIISNQEAVQATLSQLFNEFPRCFRKTSLKPLKLGILSDLFEHYAKFSSETCSKKKLRQAVKYYTNSEQYLFKTRQGMRRIDLVGQHQGEVTEQEQGYADQRLREIKRHKKTTRTRGVRVLKNVRYRPSTVKPESWQPAIKLREEKKEIEVSE